MVGWFCGGAGTTLLTQVVVVVVAVAEVVKQLAATRRTMTKVKMLSDHRIACTMSKCHVEVREHGQTDVIVVWLIKLLAANVVCDDSLTRFSQ